MQQRHFSLAEVQAGIKACYEPHVFDYAFNQYVEYDLYINKEDKIVSNEKLPVVKIRLVCSVIEGAVTVNLNTSYLYLTLLENNGSTKKVIRKINTLSELEKFYNFLKKHAAISSMQARRGKLPESAFRDKKWETHSVAACYNPVAHRFYHNEYQLIIDYLVSVLDTMKEDTREIHIVEGACGSGTLMKLLIDRTEKFRPRIASYLAFDFNEENIIHCKEPYNIVKISDPKPPAANTFYLYRHNTYFVDSENNIYFMKSPVDTTLRSVFPKNSSSKRDASAVSNLIKQDYSETLEEKDKNMMEKCIFKKGDLLKINELLPPSSKDTFTIVIYSGAITRLVLKDGFDALKNLQQITSHNVNMIIGGGISQPLLNKHILKRLGYKQVKIIGSKEVKQGKAESRSAENFFLYEKMLSEEIESNKKKKMRERNILDLSLLPDPIDILNKCLPSHKNDSPLMINLSFCMMTDALIENIKDIIKKIPNLTLVYWHNDFDQIKLFLKHFISNVNISVRHVDNDSYLTHSAGYFSITEPDHPTSKVYRVFAQNAKSNTDAVATSDSVIPIALTSVTPRKILTQQHQTEDKKHHSLVILRKNLQQNPYIYTSATYKEFASSINDLFPNPSIYDKKEVERHIVALIHVNSPSAFILEGIRQLDHRTKVIVSIVMPELGLQQINSIIEKHQIPIVSILKYFNQLAEHEIFQLLYCKNIESFVLFILGKEINLKIPIINEMFSKILLSDEETINICFSVIEAGQDIQRLFTLLKDHHDLVKQFVFIEQNGLKNILKTPVLMTLITKNLIKDLKDIKDDSGEPHFSKIVDLISKFPNREEQIIRAIKLIKESKLFSQPKIQMSIVLASDKDEFLVILELIKKELSEEPASSLCYVENLIMLKKHLAMTKIEELAKFNAISTYSNVWRYIIDKGLPPHSWNDKYFIEYIIKNCTSDPYGRVKFMEGYKKLIDMQMSDAHIKKLLAIQPLHENFLILELIELFDKSKEKSFDLFIDKIKLLQDSFLKTVDSLGRSTTSDLPGLLHNIYAYISILEGSKKLSAYTDIFYYISKLRCIDIVDAWDNSTLIDLLIHHCPTAQDVLELVKKYKAAADKIVTEGEVAESALKYEWLKSQSAQQDQKLGSTSNLINEVTSTSSGEYPSPPQLSSVIPTGLSTASATSITHLSVRTTKQQSSLQDPTTTTTTEIYTAINVTPGVDATRIIQDRKKAQISTASKSLTKPDTMGSVIRKRKRNKHDSQTSDKYEHLIKHRKTNY